MSASAKTSAANAQAMRRRTSPSSTVLPSTCSNRTNPPNAGSRGNGSKPPGINPICSNCLESDMRRPCQDFETLALPLLDPLYNFARWLCGDADEARDLVQETFAKALKGFASFRQ